MKKSKKNSEAKPFLKWAGGKRQILDHITAAIAPALEREGRIPYAEPFVGSGAVLFEVLRRHPRKINKAYINDVNADLITTWRAVRDKPYDLLERLQFLKANYLAASQEKQKILFGEARERFNQRDNTDIDQAALLVFLNKTCFNGLYRVNSHNRFNVPHGRYKSPAIVDEESLLAASEILQEVEIMNSDYEAMLSGVKEEQHVVWYFDPPYRPLSKSSAFVSYASGAFDDHEQRRLKLFCDKLDQSGHQWVLSNSDPKNTNPEDTFFDDLYQDYQVKRISARRSINSKSTGRGKLSELIITNITN